MIEREGKERKPIRAFLGVSVTADLLAEVRDCAKDAGLSVSGYVQDALRQKMATDRRTIEDKLDKEDRRSMRHAAARGGKRREGK